MKFKILGTLMGENEKQNVGIVRLESLCLVLVLLLFFKCGCLILGIFFVFSIFYLLLFCFLMFIQFFSLLLSHIHISISLLRYMNYVFHLYKNIFSQCLYTFSFLSATDLALVRHNLHLERSFDAKHFFWNDLLSGC